MLILFVVEMLALCPTRNLEDYFLSAVHYCFSSYVPSSCGVRRRGTKRWYGLTSHGV